MFEVRVSSEFSAAHCLRGYRGKCEQLHGHNWKVEMIVGSSRLDKIGMVADFQQLKKILKSALDKLDHKYLNGLSFFKKVNPTSENIAKHIYNSIKKQIPDGRLAITVWESEKACASYCET